MGEVRSAIVLKLRAVVSHTFVFAYRQEFGYYIFFSKHIEKKEITVKLLKIIKYTFRNTTNDKATRFLFTMQYQ